MVLYPFFDIFVLWPISWLLIKIKHVTLTFHVFVVIIRLCKQLLLLGVNFVFVSYAKFPLSQLRLLLYYFDFLQHMLISLQIFAIYLENPLNGSQFFDLVGTIGKYFYYFEWSFPLR